MNDSHGDILSAIIVLEELMRPVLGLYTGIVPGGEARQAEALSLIHISDTEACTGEHTPSPSPIF